MPQFEKERYILDKMRSYELVPTVQHNGSGRVTIDIASEGQIEFGYLLESRIPYEAAKEATSASDRARCLNQLGECLREVHTITVDGYGTDFNETLGACSCATFSDFLSLKIDAIERAPIDSSMKRWLTARVRSLEQLDSEPRLFHQDVLGNWGNFLVDPSRTIKGIIDWEFAGSGPSFCFELASFVYVLTRDGQSPELIEYDVASVLHGYGMSLEHFKEHYEREVETIVLLYSVAALQKYASLKLNGGIVNEPWRRVFAERAEGTVARSLKKEKSLT